MTRITKKEKISEPDDVRPPTSDSMDSKSPSGSAMLAQRLGSEQSWADRYVPGTPSETIMTPGTSIADHSERGDDSEYMTPHEAPPSYEEVTGSNAPSKSPSYTRDLAQAPQAQTQLPHRPQLPTRRYSRHETSQSITGEFTLYDSLDLSTTSGSISIRLDVQPGSEPAHLKLKSASGSISVHDKQCDTAVSGFRRPSSSNRIGSRSISNTAGNNTTGSNTGLLSFLWGSRSDASTNTQVDTPPVPTSDDPRKQPGQHLQQANANAPTASGYRVIHTTIETQSGSANAQILLTPNSTTTVVTKAGSINLRLVTSDSSTSSWSRAPLDKLSAEDSRNRRDQDEPTCTVNTTSSSGSQSISIIKGNTDTSPGTIISGIRAKHHVLGSASLHCSYPRDWEGLVHASVAGSGSVSVRGEGLQFDRRGNKEIWAWRTGDGELPDIEKAVEVRGEGSGSISFGC